MRQKTSTNTGENILIQATARNIVFDLPREKRIIQYSEAVLYFSSSLAKSFASTLASLEPAS